MAGYCLVAAFFSSPYRMRPIYTTVLHCSLYTAMNENGQKPLFWIINDFHARSIDRLGVRHLKWLIKAVTYFVIISIQKQLLFTSYFYVTHCYHVYIWLHSSNTYTTTIIDRHIFIIHFFSF